MFLNTNLTKKERSLLINRTKTIKVNVRTWDSLKRLKSENETFDEVIKDLLGQRTKSIGNNNLKGINYQRKTKFQTIDILVEDCAIEYEYNDIKSNKDDFVVDLKIKKIFYGKKIFSPSEFFGVDNLHRHYSKQFLLFYLLVLVKIIHNEFNANIGAIQNYESNKTMTLSNLLNISFWRKLYYDYNLSEDSFNQDIAEPLRLSEDEKISGEYTKKINNSISHKLIK